MFTLICFLKDSEHSFIQSLKWTNVELPTSYKAAPKTLEALLDWHKKNSIKN